MRSGNGELLLLFAFELFADFGSHRFANLFGRVFANVGDDDGDFARPDLARFFGNHFDEQLVALISAGQQQVFLWATLATAFNKAIPVLEIAVVFDRHSYVIARIELRTIKRFDQPNLVFTDDRRVPKLHSEQ